MRRIALSLVAASTAALLSAPAALAQAAAPNADSFALGGVSLIDASAAQGQAVEVDASMLAVAAEARSRADDDARETVAEQSEPELQPVAPMNDTGAPDAEVWYERFTLASPSHMPSPWGDEAAEFEIPAGERWGFTLGISEPTQGPQFEIEDMRAGAFFELNERLRLGGQFRFSSPERDFFGEQGDEQAPEIKFESAFRF
ncbi:NtrZ family periplasmic regulatory protein [Marinicauda salina]|uniref:NtrZ family periplasmic regulatory protein n=1 Tax=Marinicauda salina TaxID=2135793 RepID=UPI000D652283|nr:hypothetical protein [Marinicauda salina]